MALSLLLDGAQSRVKRGRTCAFHQGASSGQGGGYVSNWSDVYFLNSWVSPIGFFATRRPNVLTKEFGQNAAGINARWGYADFGIAAGSGGWLAPHSVLFDGENRFYRTEDMAAPLPSVADLVAANDGLFFEMFVYSPFASGQTAGWFGYGTDLTNGVGFEVFVDGRIDVYKGGQLYATGSVRGETEGTGQNASNRPLAVMAFPYDENFLLVYSPTFGGGFNVAFTELVGTGDSITPAGKVWFQTYGSSDLTFCKLQCASGDAYHCSKTLSFAERPNEDAYLATIPSINVFGAGGVTAELRKDDDSGPYAVAGDSPDELKCRVRYTIPAGGVAYAAIDDVAPVYADTAVPESPLDLRDFATGVSLEVPDSPAGVSLHLEGLDPDAIDATLRTQSNRPLIAKRGDLVFLDGRTEPMKVEWASCPEASRWEQEIRDAWKALEHHYFRDPLPFDLLTIEEALRAVVGPAVRCDFDVTSDPFTIAGTGACSLGDWSALVEVGDTSAEWVHRLMETYAGNWVYGFRPSASGIVFFAKSPDDLGATPKATLYGTRAAADLAGVDPTTGVYRAIRTDSLEPEATEVRVTGFDPIDGRAFQSFKVDEAAEDPETDPATRPRNWLGEKRAFGLFDPSITTQATADRSCELLYDRLTAIRDLAEWDCGFLVDADGVPLWRGDNVDLDGYGVYRIVALRSTWEIDEAADDGWRFQSAHYTGEMVS